MSGTGAFERFTGADRGAIPGYYRDSPNQKPGANDQKDPVLWTDQDPERPSNEQ